MLLDLLIDLLFDLLPLRSPSLQDSRRSGSDLRKSTASLHLIDLETYSSSPRYRPRNIFVREEEEEELSSVFLDPGYESDRSSISSCSSPKDYGKLWMVARDETIRLRGQIRICNEELRDTKIRLVEALKVPSYSASVFSSPQVRRRQGAGCMMYRRCARRFRRWRSSIWD